MLSTGLLWSLLPLSFALPLPPLLPLCPYFQASSLSFSQFLPSALLWISIFPSLILFSFYFFILSVSLFHFFHESFLPSFTPCPCCPFQCFTFSLIFLFQLLSFFCATMCSYSFSVLQNFFVLPPILLYDLPCTLSLSLSWHFSFFYHSLPPSFSSNFSFLISFLLPPSFCHLCPSCLWFL